MRPRPAMRDTVSRRSIHQCHSVPRYSSSWIRSDSAVGLLVAALKDAIGARDADLGREIHARAIAGGEISSVFVATTVMDMYGRLGAVDDSQRVFDAMEHPSAVSWAVLVAGYAQQGRGELALGLMESMEQEGIEPGRGAYLAALKACMALASREDVSGKKMESLVRVKKIHAEVGRRKASFCGGDPAGAVESCLIDAYARCRSMADAKRVFDGMGCRTVVAWTATIVGYADNGDGETALQIFSSMLLDGCSTDRAVFLAALKSCATVGETTDEQRKTKSLCHGRRVHCGAAERGYESDVFVANALVDMYGKCGSMVDARLVFDRLPRRSCVSWTSVILGYAQNGYGGEALLLFAAMQCEGCLPDSPAFVAALQACGCLAESEEPTQATGDPVKVKALERGMHFHSFAVSKGFVSDVFLANSLVDMYAKCGSLTSARRVFADMQHHSVVSWTALILGHARLGQGEEALRLYRLMQTEGCQPNAQTFVAVLQACSSLAEEMNQQQQVLEQILEAESQVHQSEHPLNPVVGNTLVEVYGKCGSLSNSRRVFEKLHTRNVASWTSLASAYIRNGDAHTALRLFASMQLEGFRPSAKTFTAALKACGILTHLAAGRKIHSQVSACSLDKHPGVAKSLVDFYGKCGSMDEARQVFESMADQGDVVAWSALIQGYSRQGNTQEVFDLFRGMVERDLRPDGVTFVSVLAACSHTGMVDKVKEVLRMMEGCGVELRTEHYQCLVDLLGRGNQLELAVSMAKRMQVEKTEATLTAILSSLNHQLV